MHLLSSHFNSTTPSAECSQINMKIKISLFFWFLSLLPAHISPHSSPSYSSDQHALLSFKHSLSIHSLHDWSPHRNTCNWTGVACSSLRPRVVSLNLTGMGLVGTLSPFLGNLSFLTALDLKNNSFHGQIPYQLGRLFRLRTLRLSVNKLEGNIPSTLGRCRSLQLLILSYNHLSGSIPSQLGLLHKLEILYLGGNQLTGTIPSSLGNLSSLTELALRENRLHGGIPLELGMLTQLNTLVLDTNNFTGPIPSTLGSCGSLQQLILSYNNLSGSIPSHLGLLHKLEILYLGVNQLTGTIPSTLGNLSTLTELDFAENRLHGGIPLELGMLTQLNLLALDTNNFTGPIPPALSNCTHLQYLVLYDNLLTGHVPWQFGKLSELENLYLWGNLLTGEIPSSLSNCTLLQMLELNQNQLSGTVPLEFGKLLQLRWLDLGGNHFVSGSRGLSILTALTNCSYLEEVVLSENYLAGMLPSSVSRLSRVLSKLELDSNKIEGNIPRDIGNLSMLTKLDLSNNRFNGTIPSTLSQLPNLERLYLARNNLYGRIPKSLGRAKRLGLLSLSDNMFSGQIPYTLGKLSQLRYLFLDHNQLSGKIPASLGRCKILEMLDLSYNNLRGNIPPEFVDLQNIQFYFNISSNLLQGSLLSMSKMTMVQAIDVSLNCFSGEIPASLSSCTNLQYLNLSWNSFDGTIPTSLTNLKNLEGIDLSRNNLSGAIPMAFKDMKMLQHINLSSNRLSGEVPKGGVFTTLDESAVWGNLGLCGTWLNLQPCSSSKHKRLSVSKKVIVPVVIGIAIFIMSVSFSIFFYRRHSNHDALALNVGPIKISYKELVDACGGFSQTNLLGIGSFGSIYKGILNNGTDIVVKVLNLQDQNGHRSFIRECNVLKRVRHRNVIKIISACSNLDFRALVFPFMSNGSLERWLYPQGVDENCRFNLSDRIRISMEIAQGMAYLHHHCFVEVIHCDLKPSNVLLGDDMTSYIADFGIAKLIFGNSIDSLTSTNALRGSIGYIAPEYGMGGRLSTKGDVYSYGILLLELLTRKRPTNDMFVEGINLQTWVSMDFPNKIAEVVDDNLLRDANESEISMVLACLIQLMQVGLLCTREMPQQRPNMMEIVERLEKIRGTFLGIPRAFQLPIDISPLLDTRNHQRYNNQGSHENWSTSTS